MDRIESISSSLQKMGLADLHAMNFFQDGLVNGLSQFDQTLKRLTDAWLPIQQNVERLGHYSWIVREKAVTALGMTEDKRVLQSLSDAFDVEDNARVKFEIIRQAEKFDDRIAISIVIRGYIPLEQRAYFSGSIDVFERIIARSDTNENHFVSSLNQISDEELQLLCASYLCRLDRNVIRDTAIEVLKHFAQNTSGEKPYQAVYAIAQSKHPQVKEILQSISQSATDSKLQDSIQRLIDENA